MSEHIPTLKKKVRYHFINKDNEQPIESGQFTEFYQLAIFPNTQSGKYELRKFVLSGDKFITVKTFYLSRKEVKKFLNSKKQHEYKSYNAYSLDEVRYPNMGEISVSRSDILNNDSGYSGYAKF